MSIILKASNDPAENIYFEFSNICDQPMRWGTAEALNIDPDRKDRADKTGTSAFPWFHGSGAESAKGAFDSKGLLIRDFGTKYTDFWLPREHFRDFIITLGFDNTREGQDKAIELFGEGLED